MDNTFANFFVFLLQARIAILLQYAPYSSELPIAIEKLRRLCDSRRANTRLPEVF